MFLESVKGSIMGGFHEPNEQERDIALHWLTLENRGSLLFPFVCSIVVIVGAMTFVILAFFDKVMAPIAVLMSVFAILAVFVSIKHVLTEGEKIEKVKRGEVLVADPRIMEVGYKSYGRYVHYNIVKADFRDGEGVKSLTFVISKRIKNQVEKDRKGMILKFPDSRNKRLKKNYVFIPRSKENAIAED